MSDKEPGSSSVEQPSPAARGDDLDLSLAEFDAATTKPNAVTEERSIEPPSNNQPQIPRVPFDSKDIEADLSRDLSITTLQAWANHYENERITERHMAQERHDFAHVEKLANEALAGEHVPEGFARRWLLAEAALNPELGTAWDRRYTDAESNRHARQYLNNSIKKMVREVRSMPDREATADREVVAAAVRGTTGKAPPATPPNYGRLNNKDFSAQIEKDFGFNPGV